MRVIDHFDLDLCMNDLYLNVRNLIPSMIITNKEKTEIMYLSFLGYPSDEKVISSREHTGRFFRFKMSFFDFEITNGSNGIR